ncbi:hypothetical protein LZ31DRAFT_554816, partial [Colletotrichum somersetense]
MEQQAATNTAWRPGNSSALDAAHSLCAGWNSWADDCKNYWSGNTGNEGDPKYPS